MARVRPDWAFRPFFPARLLCMTETEKVILGALIALLSGDAAQCAEAKARLERFIEWRKKMERPRHVAGGEMLGPLTLGEGFVVGEELSDGEVSLDGDSDWSVGEGEPPA